MWREGDGGALVPTPECSICAFSLLMGAFSFICIVSSGCSGGLLVPDDMFGVGTPDGDLSEGLKAGLWVPRHLLSDLRLYLLQLQ